MFKKALSLVVIACFILTSLAPYTKAHAGVLDLPAPGSMINLSPAYHPVIIKGLTVHKNNPFLFDFIVDVGQDHMSGAPLKQESEKLIKYFLAGLAIPDNDLWVNLSPYEKSRMIPQALGQTDMGRDLLEQDYILKQITASLIYPEKQLGKTFWDTVYSKAEQLYGTTHVPVNTFNKVWIMADRAKVFEHNQTAFVVDCHLKVMLEEDYLALTKHQGQPGDMFRRDVSPSRLPSKEALNGKAPQGNNFNALRATHTLASQIVKEIVLPELEKEVNTGKNFANLRQIFNSVILSTWYKRNLKQALLTQVYADKSKINGINLNDPTIKQQIYEQYLEAYKKGVFNYIKDDINNAGQPMPRKYFSGGTELGLDQILNVEDNAMIGSRELAENNTGDGAMLVTAVTDLMHPVNSAMAVRVDPKVKADFPRLFETKTINGRRLDPLQVIVALAQIDETAIPKALNARRLLLESPLPTKEKYAFPEWNKAFIDAQGNIRTFRQVVQGMIDNFLGIESPNAWRLNDEVPVPHDIFPPARPGLQVTGPSDPLNMAINQLNADVSVRMPDLEDASAAWYVPATAPKGQKVGAFAGIENEMELLDGEWENGRPFVNPNNGKTYRLTQNFNERPTTIERLAGIHLLDDHITINGKPVRAIDISLALHGLSTYGALKQNNSGNYYYVPKVQTPEEALIVEKKLMKFEELLGLPLGTIKIEALYEEGNAGRWLPVIMWIWRHRLIGTNVGRWDYIGSLIEMWKDEAVFPDPQGIGMNSPNLVAYQRYNALLNVMGGVKNGQLTNGAAIGGMAAVMLYPTTDEYGRYKNNPKALRSMKLDKLRERLLGLIFVPGESLPEGQQPTLEDILSGKVKGRLYDAYRQSWVATVDSEYVAAGNSPLRADLKELQKLIDAPEAWTEIDGRKIAPTVTSGLIQGERNLFKTLKVLNENGKIAPWVIFKERFNKPEDLFNEKLWNDLYSIPKGEITIEHVQHAFYMAAQYGFQILNGNYAAAIDDYELGLRFMNDLATYRIFVGWLWTVFHHKAKVTKDGWIKNPQVVSDLGVVPSINAVEIKAGTPLTQEIFNQVWKAHNAWTKAFFADLDQKGKASAFDRRWANVIMDVLKRQLLSEHYLQHSPRVLFVTAKISPRLRRQILKAIFDLTRQEVVEQVAARKMSQRALEARDYVFDYYPDAAMTSNGNGQNGHGKVKAIMDRRKDTHPKNLKLQKRAEMDPGPVPIKTSSEGGYPKASRTRPADSAMNGGIDLTTNGMQWSVSGNKVEMKIDPAMLARIQKEGINWLAPDIIKMTPIASLWSLAGLPEPEQPVKLASAV